MLIPPIGDAAACPTFVPGAAPGTDGSKLVGAYPPEFAPKPADSGFVLVGADVAVPGEGNSGLLPELDGAEPGTGMFVPVGFCGGGHWPARIGFGMLLISIPLNHRRDLHRAQTSIALGLEYSRRN